MIEQIFPKKGNEESSLKFKALSSISYTHILFTKKYEQYLHLIQFAENLFILILHFER